MQAKHFSVSAVLIATLTGQAIGLKLAEPTMNIIVNNSDGGSSDNLESGVVDNADDDKGEIDVVITPPPSGGPGAGPGPVAGPGQETEEESEDEEESSEVFAVIDYGDRDQEFLTCMVGWETYC